MSISAEIGRTAAFAKRYAYGVLCCLYLFTLGVLEKRNRGFLSRISEHFGSPDDEAPVRTQGIIPEIKLRDLVRGETLFQVREPLAGPGKPSTFEITVINQLIRQHSPAKLFEIGTFDGRTTLNMACNAPREATVYTLDLPTESQRANYWAQFPNHAGRKWESWDETLGAKYRGTDCEAGIVQLFGDSATFDFSPFINDIDFVFVDGAHDYDYVMSDSKIALKLLRNGQGIILWHNYDAAEFPGAVRAMDECYSKVKGFEGLRHIEGTTMIICSLSKMI